MLMILCVFLIVNQMPTTFLGFLNTQHPNIKFTFEKQVNKQIHFQMSWSQMMEINFALLLSTKKL